MSDDNMGGNQAGFIRQRRNLILISLVLFFALFHTVVFKKLIVFGTEIEIGDSLDPQPYLWVAFFYLLWRYYTYFHDLEGKKYEFRTSYLRRMQWLIERIGIKKLRGDSPELSKILQDRLKKFGTPDWRFRESSLGPKTPSNKRWTLLLHVDAITDIDANAYQDLGMSLPITVEGHTFYITYCRAWAYVLFRTSLFSEYVVPFLIAALPFFYGIYKLIIYALRHL